jgi:TolB protein
LSSKWNRVLWVAISCVLLAWCADGAPRTLVVLKTGEGKIGLDLSGMRIGASSSVALFDRTLKRDLERSGWFVLSAKGAGAIAVSGEVVDRSGYVVAKCGVKSRATGKRYFEKTFNDKSSRARALAHVVADEIVRAVKNVPGIASSRIVMIRSVEGRKDIYACDYDGGTVTRLTRDGAVCLAPTWGPEGKTVVYTSFVSGFPDVYRIDALKAGPKRRLAGYPGLNAGADISPDGKRMALTLSKDGNPDIYIKNLRSGKLKRLTRTSFAAEASPSWSPDGKKIVFVSDKSRMPQLVVIDVATGHQRKLTVPAYHGRNNQSPDWGPGGLIAFASMRGGKYQIGVIDPVKGTTVWLTDAPADHEDPSWAPDGRHIVCSKTTGYHSQLYMLDVRGDAPLLLNLQSGDWYSPSWSPR